MARPTPLALAVACALLAAPSAATAFVHNSQYFGGYGGKWGESAVPGTGAVVTWSFVADGTPVDPVGYTQAQPDYAVTGGSSIGSLRATVDGEFGHGAFDAAIRAAFATWSSVANIRFVEVPDTGVPLGHATADQPHIRVAAYAPAEGSFLAFAGAIGIGPPGWVYDWDTQTYKVNYSQTLAGDVIFNLNNQFAINVGVEDVTPLIPFRNDVQGLMLHELGHAAIGLDHPPWDGTSDPDLRVMYVGDWNNPNAPPFAQVVNHQLHPDDIAGAQFAYGLPLLMGDANHDGVVDAADFLAVEQHAGDVGLLDGTSPGDANGDGRIDGDDLLAIERHFGATLTVPIGVPVPEPGAAGLLVMPLLLVGRIMRR